MINYENQLFKIAPWSEEIMQFVKTLDNGIFMRGRTGWITRGIQNPESIYEHTCKVALAAYYLFGTKEAIAKGIVHDFPEIKKPDYMPGEIDLQNKRKGEFEAMNELAIILPNGNYWLKEWSLYENKIGIAKQIFELDKICPVIQAINYLNTNQGHSLEEFYTHARSKLKTKELISLLDSLHFMNIPKNKDAYQYYFKGLKKIRQ